MPKKTGVAVFIDNPSKSKTGKRVTPRGFRVERFLDRNGIECSLQKSSIATEDAVWFGVDDPKPQLMASTAAELGLLRPGDPTSGWVPFYIPKEVVLSTRMHLTQDQVKALLPYLQHFAKTGELP